MSWPKAVGVYGYQVYRTSAKNNKEELYATIKGAGTTFTDTKVEKGIKYTYRVRAIIKTSKTNKGNIMSGKVTAYLHGAKRTLPTKVVRKGYLFDGWYTNSACTEGKTAVISTSASGNKTYYAKWRKVSVSCPSIKSIKNVPSKKIEVSIKKNSVLNCTIAGLKKGTSYYVQVCAYCNDSTDVKVGSKDTKKVNVKVKR